MSTHWRECPIRKDGYLAACCGIQRRKAVKLVMDCSL